MFVLSFSIGFESISFSKISKKLLNNFSTVFLIYFYKKMCYLKKNIFKILLVKYEFRCINWYTL